MVAKVKTLNDMIKSIDDKMKPVEREQQSTEKKDKNEKKIEKKGLGRLVGDFDPKRKKYCDMLI